MDLEVVTIGTELLLGFTVDSNAAEISQALASIGGQVSRRTTVGDERDAIRAAVADALHRARFVIVTGGLGPTKDDITKHAVANIFQAPLELDRDYLATLERRFEKLGRGPMPETNRSQALVPRGAIVLPNPRGTAPGLWLEGAVGAVVMLPGVPHEMRWLLTHEVVPLCQERIVRGGGTPSMTRSRTLRTTGISESQLAVDVQAVEPGLAPITLAFLPTLGGVDLRLTAWSMPQAQADTALEAAVAALRPVLEMHVYGEGETDLAAVVLQALRRDKLSLAVAESCTGGLLGGRLTAIPGSSDCFAGGVISYANDSKVRDLGVSPALIDEFGAVSEQVAEAMAVGVCRRFETDVGVAVTGIAGPSGGTPEKPVGTVCFGAKVRHKQRAITRWIPGGRQEIRARATQAGLDAVRRMLQHD